MAEKSGKKASNAGRPTSEIRELAAILFEQGFKDKFIRDYIFIKQAEKQLFFHVEALEYPISYGFSYKPEDIENKFEEFKTNIKRKIKKAVWEEKKAFAIKEKEKKERSKRSRR